MVLLLNLQVSALAQRVAALTADGERATQLEADLKGMEARHAQAWKESLASHERVLQQTLAHQQQRRAVEEAQQQQALQVTALPPTPCSRR